MTYTEPILPVLLVIFAIAAWRRSWRLMAAGTLGLLFVSWSPAVWVLSQALEGWYSRRPPLDAQVQAVVLVSGFVAAPTPTQPFSMPATNTYQRALYAAWLARKLNKAVVVCGGYPGPPHVESFAATMKRILVAEGIPADTIWTEDRSQSTYENASFGAELLRARNIHRIALVTEAFHMLRAEHCFRRQGLDVVPAPTNFRGFDLTFRDFTPGWDAIRQSEQVLHEGVGLLWYGLRGRL